MARIPEYTPEEDAILLATAGLSASETNQRLRDAGFSTRDASSLKNRRNYLRNKRNRTAHLFSPSDPVEITDLAVRRQRLAEELANLQAAQEAISKELQRITELLHNRLTQEMSASSS